MEKLIILRSKKREKTSAWKPILVPPDIYEKVNDLAEDVNMVKGELLARMIEFATEYLEIIDEDVLE